MGVSDYTLDLLAMFPEVAIVTGIEYINEVIEG
mgnify:CR=1 FL=1